MAPRKARCQYDIDGEEDDPEDEYEEEDDIIEDEFEHVDDRSEEDD